MRERVIDTMPDLAGYPPKKLARLRVLSDKIARAAAERYFGTDLIMYVYLAGLAHGAALAAHSPAAEKGEAP